MGIIDGRGLLLIRRVILPQLGRAVGFRRQRLKANASERPGSGVIDLAEHNRRPQSW